jgi:hypothetical protein
MKDVCFGKYTPAGLKKQRTEAHPDLPKGKATDAQPSLNVNSIFCRFFHLHWHCAHANSPPLGELVGAGFILS